MNRRSALQLVAGIALAAAAPWSFAQVAGQDYTVITPPQPGGVSGQIEVVEFFSYACPHCNDFEPLLNKWRSTLKSDVVFRKVPVSFGRKEWADLGRLYLTLNAMGVADKLNPLVFEAIHKNRVSLEKEGVRNDWLAKQGVDVKKFNDTWRSFGVDTQARRAEQLAEAYKVQGVPSMAVDGRFMAKGDHATLLRNVDALVARVREEKTAAASAKPAAAPAKK